MATFKIFAKKDDKAVILRGRINDFNTYNDLKKKLFESYQNSKKRTIHLKETDNFILAFIEDNKNKDIYIPNDLSLGIWDNKTFNFFKEKLSLRGIQNAAYKFYIEKVKKYPIWKKKQNHAFLEEALNSSWKPIEEDIIEDVSLMKLEESKINYNKMKDELIKNETVLNKVIHKNIICNNCFKKDFNGKRFICAECKNYNLCQDCEKILYQKQIHQRNHTLIQVNKSLNDETKDNLCKYSNIIGNNNQEFKSVPSSFQLELNIINNGENDLKNCYILPVRYGPEYLSCYPKVINEEVQRNMSVKITIIVRVPYNNKGYFEGYFRMFTPKGLPFGNVIHIKVLNGD